MPNFRSVWVGLPALAGALLTSCASCNQHPSKNDGGLPKGDGGIVATLFATPHFHFDLAWYDDELKFLTRGSGLLAQYVDLAMAEPDFKFVVDQVPLLEALRMRSPERFEQLKGLVAAGRAEISGAYYVQAFESVLGSESVARQLIHGQRYHQTNFGLHSRGLWNIDVALYTPNYPDLLAQAGVDRGYRGWGLSFSPSVSIGPATVAWRGPAGAQLLIHRMTQMDYGLYGQEHGNIGGQSYADAFFGRDKEVNFAVEEKVLEGIIGTLSKSAVSPSLFGLNGDDFTAPPWSAVAVARRWTSEHPEYPVRVATPREYFESLPPAQVPAAPPEALVGTWGDYQRPIPFTVSRMSFRVENRQAEQALDRAERLATMASVVAGARFPEGDLEAAWNQVLPNQDHNVVTGTACDSEYDKYALPRFLSAKQTASGIALSSAAALAAQVGTQTAPAGATQALVLINPLAQARADVIAAEIAFSQGTPAFALLQPDGGQLTYQLLERTDCPGGLCRAKVAFVNPLPEVGWGTVYVAPGVTPAVAPEEQVLNGQPISHSNTTYAAQFEQGGHLTSLRLNGLGRELIGANAWQTGPALTPTHVHLNGADKPFDEAQQVLSAKGLDARVIHHVFSLDSARELVAVDVFKAALFALTLERADGSFVPVDVRGSANWDLISSDANRQDATSLELPGGGGVLSLALPAEELGPLMPGHAGVPFLSPRTEDGVMNAVLQLPPWTPGKELQLKLAQPAAFIRLHALGLGFTAGTVLRPLYRSGPSPIQAQADFHPEEGLATAANQVLMFEDRGDTQNVRLGQVAAQSIGAATTVVRKGPVLTRIISTSSFFGATLNRETRLYADVARIDFLTELRNWSPRDPNDNTKPFGSMVFAYFPLAVESIGSLQGAPFGQALRTDGFSQALDWRDVSDGMAGCALLDKGLPESGYFGGRYFLPLVRSVRHLFSPAQNPGSFDQGTHVREYALFPHAGSAETAKVWLRAAEWAQPTVVVATGLHAGALPQRGSLLKASEGVEVTALLREGDDFIVRLLDRTGRTGEASLSWRSPVSRAERINLLGQTMESLAPSTQVKFQLKPFEMATLRVRLAP